MTPRLNLTNLAVLSLAGKIIALLNTQLIAHFLAHLLAQLNTQFVAQFYDVTVESQGCQQSTNRQHNKAGSGDRAVLM